MLCFLFKHRKLIPEGTSVTSTSAIISIPNLRRGQLLICDLDKEVMGFTYNLNELGAVVNAKIAIAAAKGIVRARNKELLDEYGGHITLSASWVKLLQNQR